MHSVLNSGSRGTSGPAQRLLSYLLSIFLCLTPFVEAQTPTTLESAAVEGKVTILNSARVYYPSIIKKSTVYKAPAVLQTSTVFAAIPEWQLIKKKSLTDKDAEYHLLLKAANDKFNKAVSSVQQQANYDIIAETGAIKCEKIAATVITSDVIKALPKKKS